MTAQETKVKTEHAAPPLSEQGATVSPRLPAAIDATVNEIDGENRRRFEKVSCIVKVLAFWGALLCGMMVALMLPLRPDFSYAEKRELAKFPEFSVESLLSGDYFHEIDLWFSDTFPKRDTLITLNGRLQSFYGFGDRITDLSADTGDEIPDPLPPADPVKPTDGETDTDESPETTETTAAATEPAASETEPATTQPPAKDIATQNLGSVLVVGDAAYEYYNFVRATADRYTDMVNRTAASLKGSAAVYDIIVPTSTDITLADDIRAKISCSSQEDAINYMYSRLSGGVKSVNIYPSLRMHRDEYIYFRTDHHWTALGAYYAYRDFAAAKGIKPLETNSFKLHEYPGFLGAFYYDANQNPALEKNPDTVYAYEPPGNIGLTFTDRSGSAVDWYLIADVSDWAANSKYNTFIGGDNPYTKIVNHDLNDGSSCVVVKESFGNAFIPYLAAHYETIHVIDYRYWNGNVADFAKSNNVQDVIFINNISATRNEYLVNSMDAITGAAG